MPHSRSLSAVEIREIGEALYGSAWQAAMAKALGVPRQSIAYYLKTGEVNGAHAAAIIGLVARVSLQERRQAQAQKLSVDMREKDLASLLDRFDAAPDSALDENGSR